MWWFVVAVSVVFTPPQAAHIQSVSADTTVMIHTGSDLKFNPSQLTLKEGTRVRIQLMNHGSVPHNIVLARSKEDIDRLGTAAQRASATGFVPLDEKARIIAYSALAGPGQTVEFSFVVPPPGDYRFVCLYPGHHTVMFGTLTSLR